MSEIQRRRSNAKGGSLIEKFGEEAKDGRDVLVS